MRRLRHHAHVVGDQHQRHAALALQRYQQLENLLLDRDVQRGGRLVGDQQQRIAGDRHGDHHPLVHAAGELVRERAEPRLGRRNADLAQQIDDLPAHRAAVHGVMRAQAFGDLPADRIARIERGGRLLEHHRHVLADQAAALARRHVQQIVAGEVQPVGADAPGPGDQPHHRQHGDALAGAGFADDADDGARVQREVEPVDRAEHAARGGELDGEVADFQQRWHHRFNLGIQRIAQPVAEQVERQHGEQDRKARKRQHPPRALIELQRAGQHRAPFRRRRLRAEAEEAQRRRIQDRGGEAERRLHDQRRQAVRQHGVEHQVQRAGTGAARRGDVVARELRQRGGARKARVAGQRHDGDRDHRVEQAGAQDGDDHDGQQQAGEHQHDVHQPHDRGVDQAAGERGGEARARCRRHSDSVTTAMPISSDSRAP